MVDGDLPAVDDAAIALLSLAELLSEIGVARAAIQEEKLVILDRCAEGDHRLDDHRHGPTLQLVFWMHRRELLVMELDRRTDRLLDEGEEEPREPTP